MRKKVLVIEDEKIDALHVGRVINQQFPEVSLEVLTTGEQALDWVHRFRGDDGILALVLTDLSIPKMNGLELLGEFQRNSLLKNVPIVVLSGNEDPKAIRTAYESGASGYVVKPNNPEDMASVLMSTLDFWLNTNRLSGLGKSA